MKIGLYLQDTNQKKRTVKVFDKAMEAVKKSGIDLFVFPEFCYTPFSEELYTVDLGYKDGVEIVEKYCLELSEKIGCAVVFGSSNEQGVTYSMYANAFAEKSETSSHMYFKHTMTSTSAFDLTQYNDTINTMFERILYRGKRLGMTICYDCNHAAFSRGYGKNNIDILINSTGGDVVYDKWHKYNKVRAIENQCFNFCTMGYEGDYKKVKSYVYGYTPNGKAMSFTNILSKGTEKNEVGTIYVYDTENDDGGFDEDSSLNQVPTTNLVQSFFFPCSKADKLISESKQIAENLYVHPSSTDNIVLCMIKGKEILEPEKILRLLYHRSLKKIKNKKYIIINQWDHLDSDLYKHQISDILKVRSMENFCAVILESDTYNHCYQCGMNRTAQVVQDEDGTYGVDLKRTTGPEAIWKNKRGMRAEWRDGFEMLVNYLQSK